MTGHHVAQAELTARTDALDEALGIAGGRVGPDVATRVAASVAQVRERLSLGVDHTLVALVGGTGSGKSSLFNAIARLQFADVGVKRPTTSDVTACVWGDPGTALLDWLGVVDDRRIQRESELDGDTEVPLRGLVLLDLPDHDSVESAHRLVVDRLLPMVDLLVWVVDPQKYADDALHSGYLRHLVGHESAMAVVLNHIDTVRPELRGELAADVSRLLVDDGLAGVPVIVASARDGIGIADLRERLADVVERRSAAALRAGAEIIDAAELLAREVGVPPTTRAPLSTSGVVDTLVEAAGLSALADTVAAVVRGASGALPPLGGVQRDAVELARTRWLASLAGLAPERWLADVDERVASVDRLRVAADEALGAVALAVRRSRFARVLSWAALVAGAGAVITGVVAVGWWDPLSATDVSTGAVGVVAATLVVLVVLCAGGAVLARRSTARRRAAALLRDGREALVGVVRVHLLEPTLAVLGERDRVRELLAVARSVPAVQATPGPSKVVLPTA
jgi:energy-coupling factor transporter ATP-binding protein EcfA2